MKRHLLAALAAAAFLTSPALAQEAAPADAPAADPTEAPSPAKIALAQRIVDQGFPEDLREEMFFGSVDTLTAQMRQATLQGMQVDDEGTIAVLDEWLADYIADSKIVLRGYIPRLMNGLALSYASMFTQTELEDIAAFVATPSGQRFMVLSSAVLAEPNFASVNQDYMNEIQAGIPAAMQDLQGRIIEYLSNKEANEAQTES